MEPSEGPGSLDSFQLANETLRRDLLSAHTNMEVSCSDLLGADQFGAKQPASEPPLLTQSERERQKTQDSLSILGDPDSLELSKTQVEEFYNRVFPESSEPSSISWQNDATSQDHIEAKSPKGTEQAETRCKIDTHEGKRSPDRELRGPSIAGSSDPQPCTASSMKCDDDDDDDDDDDVQSLTEGGTLHSENEPQNLLEVSADQKISEEENKVDLQELESSANALPLNRDPVEGTGPEEKVEKKIGCTPAEGSVGLEISEIKPGAVTEVKDFPAASSPTENATEFENADEKLECRRAQRLRRGDLRRTSQNSSNNVKLSDDDDSDAMVDDPKDADFVPHGSALPRRSPRVTMRTQRAASSPYPLPESSAHGAGRNTSLPGIAHAQGQKPGASLNLPRNVLRPATKMHCAHCRTPLQKGQTAYQRKGMPQLFCSSTCLSTYAKRPPRKKPCVFCKKDIGNVKETVFAQTGPSGSFQEFCNNICLSLYEAQFETRSPLITDASAPKCSICHIVGEMLHEVSSGNMVHHLCSDACFNRFRATKGLKTSCCDSCGLYIYAKAARAEYLVHDGQQRRFCNTTCLAQFKKKNTKVLPCQWCKTLCKNFDMLSNPDGNGKTHLFCSVCCITSHKVKTTWDAAPARPCGFCRRALPEPAYYYKANQVVYQFCSPSCWTKFQNNSPDGDIHLNCHSCHTMFNGKPEILDWQDSIFQFCCKECCEDYKRLHGVVIVCEHCKQEKLLHDKIRFSGVEKNFCSEGCILLYKQDFTKNLGLCCINCTYCSQTCTRAVTEELDGNTWDFCSEDCKSKYVLWYLKKEREQWTPAVASTQSRGSTQNAFTPGQSPESPPTTAKKVEVTGKVPPVLPSPSPSPPLPPSPNEPQNKATVCKPATETRCVTCKPKTRSQGCQTDDFMIPQSFVMPVPVPVFIPVPLHLYCQYTPVPLTLPLPVPVPMFLPTTLENADKIVETIEELKVKIPSNPLEADILAMAEMIAEAEEMGRASSDLCDLSSNQSAEGLLEDCDLFGPAQDDVLSMAVKMANVLDQPVSDLNASLPKAPLDLNPSVEFLFDCGMVTPDSDHPEHELPVAVQKGSKQLRLSENCSRDTLEAPPRGTGLSSTFGVTAWKTWAHSKQPAAEERKTKQCKIKEDLLSCTAAELNYGLAQFVREFASPDGEQYQADVVYYMCLGIQQYLLENNRMVNIFTDQSYLTFVQELNKILNRWQPRMSPNGDPLSQVEEEHLWECKQLGVYSPLVLLNTLMFFNTKYFGLRTVEQHLQLSFSNVVRQCKRNSQSQGQSKALSICYFPGQRQRTAKDSSLGKRKREEEVVELEQQENRMNPLRCPVKFFEFYLSKCSGGTRNRSDMFYLQPERSCVAESPLWYSAVSMDRGTLGTMLNRILAVQEIYRDHDAQGNLG
ncbi:zinc finger MYM-type protein 3-like isoform X2 [Conger conger]|uniref:zinc finger MYM-type protein 3-like isoform X2 n=1 Tax=Conger conger TaxID=82655 RepID=UPI002A59892B|nr:zinc finger MYM-type protein 3-like isoform X2 [Conger conger]